MAFIFLKMKVIFSCIFRTICYYNFVGKGFIDGARNSTYKTLLFGELMNILNKSG